MQSHAVGGPSQDVARFHLFSSSESTETYMRFLNDGLPLESQLLDDDVLCQWCKNQNTSGYLSKREHLLDVLTFTFLAKRVSSNPAYYGFTSPSPDENLSFVVDALVDKANIQL